MFLTEVSIKSINEISQPIPGKNSCIAQLTTVESAKFPLEAKQSPNGIKGRIHFFRRAERQSHGTGVTGRYTTITPNPPDPPPITVVTKYIFLLVYHFVSFPYYLFLLSLITEGYINITRMRYDKSHCKTSKSAQIAKPF